MLCSLPSLLPPAPIASLPWVDEGEGFAVAIKDYFFSLKLAAMSFFLLFLHRKLGMAGQKLGSSALLCYIRPDTADPTSSFSLTVANVGTCQAVLCRGGKPVSLSKIFSLEQDPEEAQRVKDQKAIITEVHLAPCQSRLLPR